MKNYFRYYALIWMILLMVYNLVVFLIRPILPAFESKYDTRFWIAWGFIIASFIGNLIFAYIAFKAENLKKLFYNIPLIKVSWSTLIVMLVVGCVLMLIPKCPAWIAVIVCIIIIAGNSVALIKTVWAAEVVDKVDKKINSQTSFIKKLTVDTEGLLASVKNDSVELECKKVLDAVRYSDPMSNNALSSIEAEITDKMVKFANAVSSNDALKAKNIAEELVVLIGDRNRKCKILKV